MGVLKYTASILAMSFVAAQIALKFVDVILEEWPYWFPAFSSSEKTRHTAKFPQ